MIMNMMMANIMMMIMITMKRMTASSYSDHNRHHRIILASS
jgi:hypothetical protein